jgi:hypothetical protein
MLLKTTCCSLFVSNELIVVNRQLRHFLAECYIAMYIWKGNVNKKAEIIHVQVKEGGEMKKSGGLSVCTAYDNYSKFIGRKKK